MSNFICPICGRTFDKQFAMIGHKRIHSQLVINKIKNTKKTKRCNQKVKIQKTQLFLDNKYTKWYFSIIEESAKQSPEGYFEGHHIIPRCLNGSDKKSNIIKFSARKHFICHWLLTKMVPIDSPEYYALYKAFSMMSGCGNNQERYVIPSIVFEQIRIEIGRIHSINQSGKNNSQYGKIWISHPKLRESKKIPKSELDDYISNGWLAKRINNWDNYDENGNRLNYICMVNFTLKEKKHIHPNKLEQYIALGWKKSKASNFNLYDNSGNLLSGEKRPLMKLNEISSIKDFFDRSIYNQKIYNLYQQGKSTRAISQIIPLSHVAISRRIKIIKDIIES